MIGAVSSPDALAGLRRRWWVVAALAALALVGGTLLLTHPWGFAVARRWALLAGAVLGFELALLWRGLPDNHAPGGDALWPGLGLANWITILRGWAAAALAGLLALPAPASAGLFWLPAFLHLAAIAPDFLDGYVARVTGRVSVLGGRLDMEYDSVAMLAGALLAVHYGRMPWWFALVGLARYAYVLLLWLHRRGGLPIHDLTPSASRRAIAGLMMGFVNVALWPVLDVRAVALAGALLTAPHLIGFTRDALVVTGRVDPFGLSYRRLYAPSMRVLHGALPILRVIGGSVAIAFLAPSLWAGPGRPWSALLAAAALAAGALLALGAASRFAALGLLAAGVADLLARGYQPYHAVLIWGTIPILIFGPGALALWSPDEALFTGHVGASRRRAG